jgi:hypothetical protein
VKEERRYIKERKVKYIEKNRSIEKKKEEKKDGVKREGR